MPIPQAGKPSAGCVRVLWNKVASGTCRVKYEVKLKDQAGTVKYTSEGTNIGEKIQCNIPNNLNITEAQLKMSFKTVLKTFTINVSERPIPKGKPLKWVT